jgi:spore coat polysaccharide biosynthesis protein SpsF
LGIVQARHGSTRLPGKVLRPLSGRPVLGWVIRAMTLVEGLDDLVVATTDEPADDAVAQLADEYGVSVVRGDTTDVLSRFLLALDGRDVDAVARFTSDCPLMDPAVASMVVAAWRSAPDIDHVSTVSPRCLPRGMDAEVASVRALRALDDRLNEAGDAHHRTHVTSALYTDPDTYRVAGVVLHPRADDLRVTLDTEADWALLERIVDVLGDRAPRWRDVVALLRSAPELVALTADVEQKSIEAG